MTPGGVFYYDLGSPRCYLVAERLAGALPEMPEWEPVPASEVSAGIGEIDRQLIEQQASLHGLQPLRWPPRWPPDTRLAMLAATYAKQVGRGVAFSLAAFRQTFAGGRDLSDRDTVLIAAAACEMHPTALLKSIGLRSVQAALDRAVSRARADGVDDLPALRLGESLFTGEGLLEDAVGGAPMKANRAYELIVSRDAHGPAFLADRHRLDRIEVVSVSDGEVVLFWELPAKEATKLLRQLREELVSFDIEEFRRAWGLG